MIFCIALFLVLALRAITVERATIKEAKKIDLQGAIKKIPVLFH